MKNSYRVILFEEERKKISKMERYSFLSDDEDLKVSKSIDRIMSASEVNEKEKISLKNKFAKFKRYYLQNFFSRNNKIIFKIIFYLALIMISCLIICFVVFTLMGVIK